MVIIYLKDGSKVPVIEGYTVERTIEILESVGLEIERVATPQAA